MPHIIVYSTAMCPYCVRAKNLLQMKGAEWEEIRVDFDRDQMRIMMEKSNRRTVPQIFIGDYHVGGYDDLAELDAMGKLDPMLGLADSDNLSHNMDSSEDAPT